MSDEVTNEIAAELIRKDMEQSLLAALDRIQADLESGDFPRNFWEDGPAYRKGMNDIEWARVQPDPKDAAFHVGDVVRDKEEGRLCVIHERSERAVESGWPVKYAITAIPGVLSPSKVAWYYDLDLEMVEPGTARKFMKKKEE
jgi:hypothetical protein